MMTKRVKQCPNCGNLDHGAFPVRYDILRHSYFCSNCGWNEMLDTRRMTKERYQYLQRLTRLKFRGWQVFPPKRKQPTDILMPVIGELCAREIPFPMRLHFQSCLRFERERAWYWQPGTRSRWEYHMMLSEGTVKSWKEYEAFYKERSRHLERGDDE